MTTNASEHCEVLCGSLSESSRRTGAQLQALRQEVAELKERRADVLQQIRERREVLRADDDRARDALATNVMIRVDQRMTTPEIARALGRTDEEITKVIAEFRRSHGVEKGGRRRQPLPERRTLT